MGTAAVVVGFFLWNAEPKQVQEQQPMAKEVKSLEATAPVESAATTEAASTQKPQPANGSAEVPASAQVGQPLSVPVQQEKRTFAARETTKAGKAKSNGKKPAANAAKLPATEGESVFENIKLLELPDDVLAKLGIKRTEGRIAYGGVILGVETPDEKSFLKFNLTEETGAVQLGPAQDQEITTTFLPVFLSDRNGEQSIKYMFDLESRRKFEEAYFKEMVNTLVPVLVKLRKGSESKNDAVFWFEPTADFLKRLPAAVASQLKSEYDQIASWNASHQPLKTGETLAESAPAGKKTESSSSTASGAGGTTPEYFESGYGSAAAIVYATVFPNPASGRINLTMGLKQSESVRVSLVGIDGKLIKIFSDFKTYKTDTLTERFNIGGIAPGLYILQIDAKSGGRHTQRIMIQ